MKRKVLVVEDEPDVLEYLASYIPLLGYELDTAIDGVEALAKINAFKPELLILDLLLPKTSGLVVLSEVKKHHPKMKILVATGTRTPQSELTRLGADDVIYKPIDLTILSERIKFLLPPISEPEVERREFARLEIVEDEKEISSYLKEYLFEPLGLEVDTAENAEEGFEIYKKRLPHIVIVDLAIPNKEQGYNLVQKLANSTDPPPPKSIIVATAALGDTTELLKRQGYPIYDKPIDYERLKERVFEACKKHGLRLKTGLGK